MLSCRNFEFFPVLAMSIGRSVKAITADITWVTTMTHASSLKIWPAMPVTNTIGRKTQTVVSVDASMGAITSSAPAIAAFSMPPPGSSACLR